MVCSLQLFSQARGQYNTLQVCWTLLIILSMEGRGVFSTTIVTGQGSIQYTAGRLDTPYIISYGGGQEQGVLYNYCHMTGVNTIHCR